MFQIKENETRRRISLRLHTLEILTIIKESLLHPLTTSYITVNPEKDTIEVKRSARADGQQK